MTITDVIRDADSEHVVYFLLSSYVNTARYRNTLKGLPEQISALPLASKGEVRSRFQMLMLELDGASKRLDNKACATIKEALAVFGTALNRLQSLDCRRNWPLEVEAGNIKVSPDWPKTRNSALMRRRDLPQSVEGNAGLGGLEDPPLPAGSH